MGLLWRLLAPKPVKKARRTITKAAHPVHTATRAVTPKPVKQLQRAVHPVSWAEGKAEDAAVTALRGRPSQKRSGRSGSPTARAPATANRSAPKRGRFVAIFGDGRPAWMRDGVEATLLDGDEDLEVVGESHYQQNLWRLVSPHRRGGRDRVRKQVHALLVPEEGNPYDANAVSVWVQGLQVGHLSRADAHDYRPGLLQLQGRHGQPVVLTGVIAGGGIRDDGPGRLGVFLRHDPADFDC
jgi:hypothetical protein